MLVPRHLLPGDRVVHWGGIEVMIRDKCRIWGWWGTLLGLCAGVPFGVLIHWWMPRVFQWLLP